MDTQDDFFDAIWRRQQEAASAPLPDKRCSYAQQFALWAEELCRTTLPKKNLMALNQAKVLLVDQYFSWKAYVPKSHRDRIGGNGHICIFHIFEACYEQIRLAELALRPPEFAKPRKPRVPTMKIPAAPEFVVDSFSSI